MGIEELKSMKTQLMSCVQGQLGNLQAVDTKQLGEAIDMIKDLSQAIYYCTITESMEKAEQSEGAVRTVNYYTPMMGKIYPDDYYRNRERETGYMYYPTGGNSSSNSGGTNSSNSGTGMSGGNRSMNYYTDPMYHDPRYLVNRDPREGRAAMRRRMYMEGKEMHNDTNSQLRELEAYLQELSTDITEMIRDASPEEKATLHQKMTTLASKIA